MTAYFEATDPTALLLLPKPLRAHPDLPTIAATVEADVLSAFTERVTTYVADVIDGSGYDLGDGVSWIRLWKYVPDASACTDNALVSALQRTIADVIAWRLSKEGENPALASVATGQGVTKTKSHSVFNNPFPPGHWERRLARWDLREAVYGT